MKCLKNYALAGLALAVAAAPLFAQQSAVIPAGILSRGGCCPPPAALSPDCPVPPLPGLISPTPVGPGGTGQGDTGAGTDLAALPERTGGAGIGSSAEFTPFFGDLIGVSGNRVIVLPRGVTPPAHTRFAAISGNKAIVIAPLPARSMFNIAENESPRPTDRVFVDYDYFANVDRLLEGIPGTNANLHRETIGFEKTFLDGNASFGMRLPILELVGGNQVEESQVDDLTMVFKYALINNRETGNVLSGGLVLTVPTGPGLEIEGQSVIHSTVFQPFVGYIYHVNRDLFFQGFSSIAAPTDSRDVTIWFNSLGAGYQLYRAEETDAGLRGIVPVVEMHVNTPLNHRGLDSGAINFSDSVDFTAGAYFQFRRATLGLAVGAPVTGPKPYDVEATASLNIHF